MQLWGTIFVTALVEFLASVAAGEGSCKFYVKMFDATKMDCFIPRGDSDPVCGTTKDMSSKHCHIGTRHHQMCIKWPVTTSIMCRNETFNEEMEGTAQDCAADQESMNCTEEFSSDSQSSTPEIKAGWLKVLFALIVAVVLITSSSG
ncbi:hypothetical protein SKAU_G00140300 [Synaphobranchus kaupii]|uniref:Secreted protein n=1 Tax=Synaphobranchus kaupii TaxID=118154 RepID=A0A9Q1FSG4_SYNKA|nr:hypothetical protein SKAU_G00140300 [Synaphobranchus kaupii]